MNKKLNILAIDPGYDRCGVAVLEKHENKERLIFSHCIQTNKKDDFYTRIAEITDFIEKIIQEYKPDILAIEKLYFNTNQKTAILVAQTSGAIISLALKNKMQIFEYTPLQIKIATTGSGRASKKELYEFLPKLIKIDKKIKLDDEYDAIACALTCSASEKF